MAWGAVGLGGCGMVWCGAVGWGGAWWGGREGGGTGTGASVLMRQTQSASIFISISPFVEHSYIGVRLSERLIWLYHPCDKAGPECSGSRDRDARHED